MLVSLTIEVHTTFSLHPSLPRQDGRRNRRTEGNRLDESELAKLARADGQRLDRAPWVHKARTLPKESFRREVSRGHMRFIIAKGRVNGSVFVEFLKRLLHNTVQPILLILDAAATITAGW